MAWVVQATPMPGHVPCAKPGRPFFRRYLSPDESITKKYSQGPAPMFVKE
jgi:hypothetical protein